MSIFAWDVIGKDWAVFSIISMFNQKGKIKENILFKKKSYFFRFLEAWRITAGGVNLRKKSRESCKVFSPGKNNKQRPLLHQIMLMRLIDQKASVLELDFATQ